MMSIGTALNAAATHLGTTLPTGLIGARIPLRAAPETVKILPAEGTLLVAVEEGLREAGYLSDRDVSARDFSA